jgi:ADP-heptose:LPS heptosyltransferase
MDILPAPNVSIADGRWDIFQDGVFDHVVIGPHLGMCPSPEAIVREMVAKLRQGGHVVLYLKKNWIADPKKFYGNIPTSLPPTRVTFDENSLIGLLESSGAWRVKYQDTRGEDMLIIAKKIAGRRGEVVPYQKRSPEKRACIVRYGALGDMVMITPLIRRLAEDGYEVTMNITPYAAPLLDNNPYVANIVFQEREAIPNKDLGEYWAEWKGDYEKYINLSESIEGRLLKVEGRRDFFTTKAWREDTCGSVNYYDHTMALGGYPEAVGTRGELFFSPGERKEALALRKELAGKFVVGWGMKGSSYHKIYPLVAPVLWEWLPKNPNVVVFLLGSAESQPDEFDDPQVIRTCGKWSLRKSLAFLAFVADAVVGPESMVMNVAACYDMPKVTFLSHSNHTNLCKYWTNDYCLEPDTAIAPCYPCHQLHYTLESCPLGQLGDRKTGEVLGKGPICAMGAINGRRLMNRLDEILTKHGPHRSIANPALVVV